MRMLPRSLLAVALALVALMAGPVPAQAQAPAPGEPRLRLLGQPIAVAPDGEFSVIVGVERAPQATEIAVDIYDQAQPDELVGIEPDEDPEATFEVVPLGPRDPDGSTVAGFAIELFTRGEVNPDPAWGHQIDEPGVYPVRIRLRGPDGQLATMMTALTRLPAPGQTVQQRQGALLIDVHRPPPSTADGRAEPERGDPMLARQLAPVLAALAGRPELPATFSVTPDTAVRLGSGDDPDDVLGQLRTELGRPGRELLDAPYVDLDVASLVDNGLGGELAFQRDLGRETLTTLLEPPLEGTWQLYDPIGLPSFQALIDLGIDRTILPGDGFTNGAGTTAPAELGDVRASVSSEVYTLGAAAPTDPVLAAHLLLARLAAAGSTIGEPATVVIGISPELVSIESVDIVFDALAFGTPFYGPTSLDELLSSPGAGVAPLTDARPRDLGNYPPTVSNARASLDSYTSMVGNRPDLLSPFELTLAVSAAKDLPLDERTADAAGVSAGLAGPLSAISIPARDKVTLGTADGRFPLVVTSDLDYPVQVVIEIESNDRLEFPSNRIETTLDERRQVVDISVRSRASGDTPVNVTVRSPDDGVILAEGRYSIRSTAVSGVGIVLTIGAAAFLALWWGRHWHRDRV